MLHVAPKSVFAKRVPADVIINRVLRDPYVSKTIANPKFNRQYDVPYGAGPNKTKDGVVNLDKHIPSQDVINGRTYDPGRPTAIHEIVEQHIANTLKGGPDQIYKLAHHVAEHAERKWIESNLGPRAWEQYQQHWAKWLAPIEHEDPANPPPDLAAFPYPHRNVHDAPQTRETEPVFARAERRIGVAPTPKRVRSYQEGGPVEGTQADTPDYDYEAWQQANPGVEMAPDQHYPDTYKLPNHPTFSDESIYHGKDGAEGGHWDKLPDKSYTFTPGKTNLEHFSTKELRDYFKKVEPGNRLILPKDYQQGGPVEEDDGDDEQQALQAEDVPEQQQPEQPADEEDVEAPTEVETSGTGAGEQEAGAEGEPVTDPDLIRKLNEMNAAQKGQDEIKGETVTDPDLIAKLNDLNAKKEGRPVGALREVAHQLAPLAGGVAAGAATGAALGSLFPGLGTTVGGIIGGIGGGIAGGTAVSAFQEWALDKLGLSDAEKREANRAAYPNTMLAAEVAPMALIGRPSAFWKAGQRLPAAAMATLGGGLEAGQELVQGEKPDLKRIGAQAAAMGVFSGAPTAIGRALGGIGERFRGGGEEPPPPPPPGVTEAQQAAVRSSLGGEPPPTPPTQGAAREALPEGEAAPATGTVGTGKSTPGSEAKGASTSATPPIGAESTADDRSKEPSTRPAMAQPPEGIPDDVRAALAGEPIPGPTTPPEFLTRPEEPGAAASAAPARDMRLGPRGFYDANAPKPPVSGSEAPVPPPPAPAAAAPVAPPAAPPAAEAPAPFTLEPVPPRQAPRAPAGEKPPQSLLQFIAARGGISTKDPNIADVRAIVGKNPRLFRKDGMSLDKMRRAAVEAGYIDDPGFRGGGQATSTVNTLLEHMDRDVRGDKVYPYDYRPEAKPTDRDIEEQQEVKETKDAILKELRAADFQGDPLPEDLTRATELVMKKGMDPLDAYEQAAREGERNAELPTENDPGYRDLEDFDEADRGPTRPAGEPVPGAGQERARPGQEGEVPPLRKGAPGPVEAGAAPRTEQTPAGEQGVIPGAERISDAELAQRRADERLRPTADQRPANEGLFGEPGKQRDIEDKQAATKARIEEVRARSGGLDTATAALMRRLEERAVQIERGTVPERELPPERMGRVETSAMARRRRGPMGPQGPAAGPRPGQGPPPGGFTLQRPPSGPGAQAPRPITGRIMQTPILRALKKFWTGNFQPELGSERSLWFEPRVAEYKATAQQRQDVVYHQTRDDWHYVNKLPIAEQQGLLDRWENNTPANAKETAIFDRWKPAMQMTYLMEKSLGSKAGYIKDYLSHIWEKPKDVNAWMDNTFGTDQVGPRWFQKGREFDYIKDGLAAGFKLKYNNLIDIVAHRLNSGIDMQEKMKLLYDMKPLALAWEGVQGGDKLAARGWQRINAPDGKQWMIGPEAQSLWKNGVDAKGLWQDQGLKGDVFRGWMALKAAWIPIKIGLSLFHPLHVVHISYSEGMGRAWDNLVKGGDFAGAMRSLRQGFTDPFYPGTGIKARAQWELPEVQRTAQGKEDVQRMTDGGFVPQLSAQFKERMTQGFHEAWQSILRGEAGLPEWRKMAMASLGMPIKAMQNAIFEKWIPNIKASAYLHAVQDILSRRPELLTNNAERKLAFHTIAQDIDSRFGEKFYGTMFMNRFLKDSAIASFLSLGWNYGFLHQFGGAAMQAVTRPAGMMGAFAPTAGRQIIRDATNKIPFALSYLGSAALINGLMTYAFTGEMPKGLDYIFARIGGKNPDNTDRRVTNMFYLREYPMLQKHIQSAGSVLSGTWDMVSNKLMFQPFSELLHNKDYYGFNIWDENAPIYQKVWQAMRATMGEQLSPMSISGATHGMELSGKKFSWTDPKTWGSLTDKSVPLALLGFGPAPAYVEKDAMQNRISQLFKDHVAPASKTQEERESFHDKLSARTAIAIARRDKDNEALREGYKQGQEAGMTRKSMEAVGRQDTDTYLFSRLPRADQRAILRDSSDIQKNKYLPKAKDDVKMQYKDWRREHPAASFNPAYTE